MYLRRIEHLNRRIALGLWNQQVYLQSYRSHEFLLGAQIENEARPPLALTPATRGIGQEFLS